MYLFSFNFRSQKLQVLKTQLEKMLNKLYENVVAVTSAPQLFTLESSAARLPPRRSFIEPSSTVLVNHVQLLNLLTLQRTGYRVKALYSTTSSVCDWPKTVPFVSSPSVKWSVKAIKVQLDLIRVEQMKVVTSKMVGCCLAQAHATGSSLVVILVKIIIQKEVVIAQFFNKKNATPYPLDWQLSALYSQTFYLQSYSFVFLDSA